ncbi:hypothetical protein VaNZ11_001805, partial [Volvox africanus]
MVLGVSGDLLGPDEPRTHYLTKVGGTAFVPSTTCKLGFISCTWKDSSICRACGKGLSLVFQAYAPISTERGQSIERVLLVLGCTHPGCGQDARSWRAFRCQLAAPSTSSVAPQLDQQSEEQMLPASASTNSTQGMAPAQAPAQAQAQAQAPAPASAQAQAQASGRSDPANTIMTDVPSPHGYNLAAGNSEADPFGGGFDFDDGFGFGDGSSSEVVGASSQPVPAGASSSSTVVAAPDAAAFDFADLGAVLEGCAIKQRMNASGRGCEVRQHQGKSAAAIGNISSSNNISSHRGDERRQRQQQLWPQGVESATAGGSGENQLCAHGSSSGSSSLMLPLTGPLLPEFHIIAVEEPTERRRAMRPADDDHVKRLLAEYESLERRQAGRLCGGRRQGPPSPSGFAAGASSSTHSPRPAAATDIAMYGAETGRSSSMVAGSSGMEGVVAAGGDSDLADGCGRWPEAEADEAMTSSWAGEEYEEDHVRGVQGPYLKYAARLALYPEQCARYALGGDVLWPLRSPPRPPPCGRCGSPRVFEMQLMAPLLAMVLDCADWLSDSELERHRTGINAAANWDFTTLAVYTCTANCHLHHQGRPQVPLPSGSSVTAAAADADDAWVIMKQQQLKERAEEGVKVLLIMEEHVEVVSEDQCHVPEELKI